MHPLAFSRSVEFVVSIRRRQLSTSVGVRTASEALARVADAASDRGAVIEVVGRDGRYYSLVELQALALGVRAA